jgi:glutamine cyclotransferase
LRRVDLDTGAILQIRETPAPAFGEGVTQFNDRIYQLTLGLSKAFVYDATTFDHLEDLAYEGQGWGLTDDGTQLIMSTGNDTLYFRDPVTFDILNRVAVTGPDGERVTRLNELEYINGRVYANIFERDDIVIIIPETGEVIGRIDLSGILASPPGVLNGIAYIAETDRLLVTGKYWPTLFEIDLIPVEE